LKNHKTDDLKGEGRSVSSAPTIYDILGAGNTSLISKIKKPVVNASSTFTPTVTLTHPLKKSKG
jgi:hypothetical protein